jgi:hypothetical protein
VKKTVKTCGRCGGDPKPLSAFYTNPKGWISSWCRACKTAYSAEYRLRPGAAEAKTAADRRYKLAHAAELRRIDRERQRTTRYKLMQARARFARNLARGTAAQPDRTRELLARCEADLARHQAGEAGT